MHLNQYYYQKPAYVGQITEMLLNINRRQKNSSTPMVQLNHALLYSNNKQGIQL